jgi:type IV pilus assembly protein PilC
MSQLPPTGGSGFVGNLFRSELARVIRKVIGLFGLLFVLTGLSVLFAWGFGPPGGLLFLLLLLFYGWMVQTFVRYRTSRQEELLFLLATTIDQGAPLAPALHAYLGDRREKGWRAFWAGLLLFFVFPGYYWLWHRRHSYDQKLRRVANRLEMGDPLPQALLAEPGVASGTTVLALAVGEASGRPAVALKRLRDSSLGSLWIETVPRLFYPLLLLLFLNGLLTFWLLFLYPRMERMYLEFGTSLPALTQAVADVGTFLFDSFGPFGLWVLLLLMVLPIYSPTIRWYYPLLGRVYRLNVQSQVLKMLGVLLEAGKPASQSIRVLVESGALPWVAERRLERAEAHIDQGQSLADALRRVGLLSVQVSPLIAAAQRANNLPWAMTELGTTLASRATWLARRLSLGLFSVAVISISVLVGLFVIAMFLPLIKLILELSL